jgi:hypothetical protein
VAAARGAARVVKGQGRGAGAGGVLQPNKVPDYVGNKQRAVMKANKVNPT